jgi:hypothetical protein
MNPLNVFMLPICALERRAAFKAAIAARSELAAERLP